MLVCVCVFTVIFSFTFIENVFDLNKNSKKFKNTTTFTVLITFIEN